MPELNFSPFPQLTTERLVLRQLTAADAVDIAALRSNEIVNQYLNRPKKTTPDDALVFIDKITKGINNNQSIYWVIAQKENNHLIGAICLWNIVAAEDRAEIGYELHPEFHGKGVMQEAMQAVIDFAFNKMLLKIITAFTTVDNIASIKSLERNHFKLDTAGKYTEQDGEEGYVYVLEKM